MKKRRNTKFTFAAAMAACISSPAAALDWSFDDGTTVTLDTTVKLSGGERVSKPDPSLLNSVNTDDGQRAFKQGQPISERVDVLMELDVTHENVGFTASGAAWYDAIYNEKNSNGSQSTFNGNGPSDHFNDAVRNIEGRYIELLNAYAHGDFHLGETALNVRVGQYALQWGEAIFSTDSIAYGMAPTDIIKATGVPGSQIKELLLPVPQASFSLQITPKVTFEGYAQFEFRPDRFPAAGSYFELADFLGAGDANLLAGTNPFNPNLPLSLTQNGIEYGRNIGQFGFAAKYHPTTNLDVGFYFVEFDDKQPQIYSTVPTTSIPFGPTLPTAFLNPAQTAATGHLGTYTEGYARNIQIYGASATTTLGPVNFGFETSVRTNMDLESKSITLASGQTANFSNASLYSRGTTLHYIANALYIGETTRFWDGITVIGEISGSHLLGITANAGNFNPAYTHNELGTTLVIDPTYFQVRPALDIDFPVTWGWNIQGNGPWSASQNYSAFYGGYVSAGVAALYQRVWRGGVQYTHFYGGTGFNTATQIAETPFLGRDFVSFNVQRSF